MEDKKNFPTKEYAVQIENINFHVLIVLAYWSGGERPLSETMMHHHVFHELFICEQGEIHIKTSEGNILLKDGDIAVIPPTISHVLQYMQIGTQGYFIPFSCKKVGGENNIDLYKKLLPILDEKIQIFRDCPIIIKKTKKIIDEAYSDVKEKFISALHLLELLLNLIEEKNEKGITFTECLKNEPVQNDIERMMHLDSLIATKYHQKCSCADFAEELYISTRQLDRIANKHYGKSFHKLIVDRRFDFAEKLLITTDMTVEQVAVMAGFGSNASFYREFKKRYGCTPMAFRKRKL